MRFDRVFLQHLENSQSYLPQQIQAKTFGCIRKQSVFAPAWNFNFYQKLPGDDIRRIYTQFFRSELQVLVITFGHRNKQLIFPYLSSQDQISRGKDIWRIPPHHKPIDTSQNFRKHKKQSIIACLLNFVQISPGNDIQRISTPPPYRNKTELSDPHILHSRTPS